MKNTLLIYAAVTSIAFVSPSFADDISSNSQTKTTVEKDSDGSVQKKRTTSAESTDASGTTNTTETKVKEDVDASGNGERTVTTTNVTDPKGLMNKTKIVTKDSVKSKDGQTEATHSKKVNGTTVEEHSEKASH